MIIIRITRADLVLPRYLYHVLDNIKWGEIEGNHGMSKFAYAKSIKMRSEDRTAKPMKLGELCKVTEVDRNSQVSLMRGDITINDINQVNIIE